MINFYSRSCIILMIIFISYSLLVQFLFIPIFISCSLPIHSCSFQFISVHFLFISYSLPIHFLFMFIRFFIAFDLRNLPKFPKAMGFLLSISYLKTIYFKPQINWDIHFQLILCLSVSRVFQKCDLYIKGVVNKVWGLDGLTISCSFLMDLLVKSYSFPIQFLSIFYSFPVHFSSFHLQSVSKTVIRK